LAQVKAENEFSHRELNCFRYSLTLVFIM